MLAKVRFALSSTFPATVYVRGILSEVKKYDKGWVFMELVGEENKDERLSCVIWRGAQKMCKPLQEAGFSLEPDSASDV